MASESAADGFDPAPKETAFSVAWAAFRSTERRMCCVFLHLHLPAKEAICINKIAWTQHCLLFTCFLTRSSISAKSPLCASCCVERECFGAGGLCA